MIRRSSKHAMLGGVCAGYAIAEKKPVALVRTFVILMFLLTAGLGGALVYIAAWIFMPTAEEGPAGWDTLPSEDELARSKSNKVFGGVCGAVAEYFEIDASLVRAITVCLFLLGGVGFWTYLFAWVVIPERKLATD